MARLRLRCQVNRCGHITLKPRKSETLLNPTEIKDHLAALAACAPSHEAFGFAMMEAVSASKGTLTKLRV